VAQHENYVCVSDRNYSELLQSRTRQGIRSAIDGVGSGKTQKAGLGDPPQAARGRRPTIISHNLAATCWQPQVKNLTMMVNSIYNGWRMEDVWLDR
jgi:peptide/nickel transport system substrate-binding protein